MEYEIIWSLQIQEEIKDINDYLLEEWGFLIANKFADKLIDTVENLKFHPHIGKRHSEVSAVRQILIPPHNLLYYTVNKNIITALNLVDSRIVK
jgi:plasmid stabilization system protein ParE